MNIFILDEDPKKAAQYLCDKHVVKMLLESAQMLCTVHWTQGNEAPYKKCHVNHPCTIWARESIDNYNWLLTHGKEICKEYTKRYSKIHKSQAVIEWAEKNVPRLPKLGLTPFRLAMPDHCKTNNVVESYRKYYHLAKRDFAKWKCEKPDWWIA